MTKFDQEILAGLRSRHMSCRVDNRYEILIFEDAQEEKERRQKQKQEKKDRLNEIEEYGRCEGFQMPCDKTKNVEWRVAMTKYCWDIDKDPLENPNRPLFLCNYCSNAYIEYWTEVWKEYHSGLLSYL